MGRHWSWNFMYMLMDFTMCAEHVCTKISVFQTPVTGFCILFTQISIDMLKLLGNKLFCWISSNSIENSTLPRQVKKILHQSTKLKGIVCLICWWAIWFQKKRMVKALHFLCVSFVIVNCRKGNFWPRVVCAIRNFGYSCKRRFSCRGEL